MSKEHEPGTMLISSTTGDVLIKLSSSQWFLAGANGYRLLNDFQVASDNLFPAWDKVSLQNSQTLMFPWGLSVRMDNKTNEPPQEARDAMMRAFGETT